MKHGREEDYCPCCGDCGKCHSSCICAERNDCAICRTIFEQIYELIEVSNA